MTTVFFLLAKTETSKTLDGNLEISPPPPTPLLPVSGNLFLRQASSELLESPSIPTSHISLVECLDFSLSI